MSNYTDFNNELNRKAYHDGEWKWEEDGFTVYRSHAWSAPGCHNSCGTLFYIDKEGRLDHVEGDPLSPTTNGKLCMRCLDMPTQTNHPNRIKYPMKRAREDRGNNEAWERISWDEALDIIYEKGQFYKETYGPQSIAVVMGTGRNIGVAAAMLAYLAFETPVNGTWYSIGISCYAPRRHASRAILGDFWIADASMSHEDRYDNPEFKTPGVICVWATEPLKSNSDGYVGHWLVECVQLGSKIISVDPRLTWWGARADYWLPVRPGTDIALGMALCNVLIQEDLYNHDFVNNWCYGFNEFAEAVADMTPERAGEICGIDPEDIRGAARLWATEGPGTIDWGLALEQGDADCMGANQSILAFAALCGYIDCPGGCLIMRDSFGITHHLSESILPADKAALDPEKVAPNAIWGETRQTIWDWENHDPKRVRMAVFQSCNSIGGTSADSKRLYDIWKDTLEFVVGVDYQINPTLSAFADLLCPISMSIERNAVRAWWTPLRSCTKMTTYYEAMEEEEFCAAVIDRFFPGRFPMLKSNRDFLNMRLHDQATGADTLTEIVEAANRGAEASTEDGETWSLYAGDMVRAETWDPNKTFEYLEQDQCGYMYDKWNDTYYKYEKGMLRSDGQPGFNTTTGRIELYSLGYMAWGQPPLPVYREPSESPISTPELFEKYPLINVSGVRSYEFFHSENRNSGTMREFHQWPLVCMNPKVAEKYGIEEGQWTWIENDLGRFRQVAHIVQGIRDDMITTEHGWWFPEDDPSEPTLFRTFDSNPNNCIDLEHVGPYGVGAGYKTTLVKIYPAKPDDIDPTKQVVELGGFPYQKARRAKFEAKWKELGREHN